MIVYGLANCDTTRAAVKALAAAGRVVRLRDVRAEPLGADEISRLVAALGPGLVNRASTTWRALSEAERALPPADLLARHPAVMKRPVIESDGRTTLGWGAAVQGLWLA